MKIGTTLFLKISIILIGIPVLLLSLGAIPWLFSHPVIPIYSGIIYPIIVGLYFTSIPFYIALFNGFKLLNYIDKNIAFSDISVRTLKNIRSCAISICLIYTLIMPFVYLLADKDDAPGLIIMGMIPLFASLVVAVFSAVLQKLLQEAIIIKLDNDLTV
ncbi:DUF2975 domain-containing protein [Alkalibacter mobilis]|uniref:DUF2975 domain-containing protein n=1 Tax=Alkalibacter mobilis TaxID=2787712 RepID=UPI0018A01B68|nr:DUF2975 domain-containing protein [Alkalibacter mobilis]MBF7097563.1 DUF2975 domain-containing protein [Alkalibacter mobilis]